MNAKTRSLRAVALTLPGVLVASLNLGAYTGQHVEEHGVGFSADADLSDGYVFAKYDRAGVGLDGWKTLRGQRSDFTWDTTFDDASFSGQVLVTVSTWYAPNSYVYGEARVYNENDVKEAHGWVD